MAKKNKEIAAENDASNIVLPNQIPARFIAPVDQSQWENLGDNFWNIPVNQFTDHPENSKIFKNKPFEQIQLENSIALTGVLVPAIANMRSDGELRVVSGHRRLSACEQLGIEKIRTEILYLTDEEELLLLFASNINRNMSDSAKVRFFKYVLQTLCQISEDDGETVSYHEQNSENIALRRIVSERGLAHMEEMSKYEFVTMITGFSEHEQKVLVRVCDEKYRERVIEKIRGIKGMSKKADEIKEIWEHLEISILQGHTTLLEVDKDVVNLNKIIEKALKGKVVKEKPLQKPKAVKEKAAPIVEEKPAFDMSNIDAILEAFSEIIYEEFCEDFNIEINGNDFDILSPKIKKFGLSLLKFMAEQK